MTTSMFFDNWRRAERKYILPIGEAENGTIFETENGENGFGGSREAGRIYLLGLERRHSRHNHSSIPHQSPETDKIKDRIE